MPKKLTDWHKERGLTYLRENRGSTPKTSTMCVRPGRPWPGWPLPSPVSAATLKTDHSRNRGTCTTCWKNFMDHFQDFYQGTGPEVTYCKRFKGDRTKTAAEGQVPHCRRG